MRAVARREKRRAWLCGIFGTALTLQVAACRHDAPSSWDQRLDLFGGDHSDSRLLDSSIVLDSWPLDGRSLLARASLGGATGRLRDSDLEVIPDGNDPTVTLKDPLRANHLAVELRSARDGHLELFWAADGEEFSEIRKRRLFVPGSPSFGRYEVDLWSALDVVARPYRFRIDPIDTRSPVTIRSVTFSREARVPRTAGSGDSIGAVSVANETREAVSLLHGRWVSPAFRVRPGDRLTFGVARSKDDDGGTRLTVAFTARPGRESVLLEATLDARSVSWTDHEVDLASVAGTEGRLAFRAEAHAPGPTAGFVFISRPRVISPRAEARHPNVILVSIDTVGAGHVPATERKGSFLSRMAREGVAFDNAFANSSLTHSSHASMLTGLAPLRTGTLWMHGGTMTQPTLASFLREEGYATLGITGGVLVTADTGFARGFDSFYEEGTLYKDPLGVSDVRVLFARAFDRLRALRQRPFFLFLHSYEPHGPYYLRPDLTESERRGQSGNGMVGWTVEHLRGRAPLSPVELGKHVFRLGREGTMEPLSGTAIDAYLLEEIRDTYRTEIRYVDERLEDLFDALGREGLLENTAVVLTSDHGEAFGEHGLLEHGLLYDENLHVPLALWSPGRLPRGARRGSRVSLMDVAPTVLDLVGLNARADLDGHSLLPLVDGRASGHRPFHAFVPGNGFAWFDTTGHKWILRAALDKENFGRNELFRVDQDPEEWSDLLRGGGQVPAALRRMALDTLDTLPGIHLSLRHYAGRETRMRLVGGESVSELLYAWDMEVLGNEIEAGRGVAWTVRFGSNPRLVVAQPELGSELSLVLSGKDRTRQVFRLSPANLGLGAVETLAAQGATVTVWRVTPKPAAGATVAPPKERLEQLRALGYIR